MQFEFVKMLQPAPFCAVLAACPDPLRLLVFYRSRASGDKRATRRFVDPQLGYDPLVLKPGGHRSC
jgi:hypothetical protein